MYTPVPFATRRRAPRPPLAPLLILCDGLHHLFVAITPFPSQAGGNVLRLVGLYHKTRGAHTFFMKAGDVARPGAYVVNLLHYEDAAGLAAAVSDALAHTPVVFCDWIVACCTTRDVAWLAAAVGRTVQAHACAHIPVMCVTLLPAVVRGCGGLAAAVGAAMQVHTRARTLRPVFKL